MAPVMLAVVAADKTDVHTIGSICAPGYLHYTWEFQRTQPERNSLSVWGKRMRERVRRGEVSGNN